MNNMPYWKLLSTATLLMIALCVGVYFYAKWDVQRFAESLGEPYTPAPQKVEPTPNFAKQAPREMTNTPETEPGHAFEGPQETEPQITDTAAEDASFDGFLEFFNELEDEELAASDTTETGSETFADFLQDHIADFSEVIDSSVITIDGLDWDSTQTGEWIELKDVDLKDVDSGGIISITSEELKDRGYTVIIK